MYLPKLMINKKDIETLSKKWHIREFAIFGSVLSEDFRQDSDIDVLIQFEANTNYSLFDLVDLKEELEELFDRPVDILEKSSIRNPFRKREIIRTARIIYAAK